MMAIARVLEHFPEAEQHLPAHDVDDGADGCGVGAVGWAEARSGLLFRAALVSEAQHPHSARGRWALAIAIRANDECWSSLSPTYSQTRIALNMSPDRPKYPALAPS